MLRALRILGKTIIIFAAMQIALAEIAVRRIVAGRSLTSHERTSWLQRWCRRILKLLAIVVDVRGTMPVGPAEGSRSHGAGLLVANHLSYLDILVFGALAPSVFVAKMEVRSWALIGRFARLGGAIFLDRWKIRAWPEVVAEVEEALRTGELVVAFPEATTTDGAKMLPFRPAMFEGAVRCGAPVTAAHIWYTLEDGSFGRSLCWFGDVHGTRHLMGCFGHRRIRASVTIGKSHVYQDRRLAAQETFACVNEWQKNLTTKITKDHAGNIFTTEGTEVPGDTS
jgi:1-acyl-sn-glycerol-3-phosphate acyltransferase